MPAMALADAASRAVEIVAPGGDHKAAIRAAMDARAMRTGVTATVCSTNMRRSPFTDMRDFADWGPQGVRFVAAKHLSPLHTPVIAELVDDGSGKGLRRVKLFDKFAALRSLQRIFAGGAISSVSSCRARAAADQPNGAPAIHRASAPRLRR